MRKQPAKRKSSNFVIRRNLGVEDLNQGKKSKIIDTFGLKKEVEFQLDIEDLEVIDEGEERKSELIVSKVMSLSQHKNNNNKPIKVEEKPKSKHFKNKKSDKGKKLEKKIGT